MQAFIVTGLVSALIASQAFAAEGQEQARIPFADKGGIDSWRAVDDDTLYIKGRSDQWYRAELFGPCIGLGFDPAIGFVVEHGSTFDRTSSIVVDGRECHLSSLVEVPGPPQEGDESGTAAAADASSAEAAQKAAEGTAPKESADAAQSPSGESASARAQIPFADLGGIEDWRAVNEELLYVQGRNNQWYRAELFGRCTGLMFQDTIGFVLEPSGAFDRFSSIMVDGHECPIASLTRSGPPGSQQATSEPSQQPR